jgi:hypothetical protein
MVTIGTGRDDPRGWVRAAYAVLDVIEQAGPRDKLPTHPRADRRDIRRVPAHRRAGLPGTSPDGTGLPDPRPRLLPRNRDHDRQPESGRKAAALNAQQAEAIKELLQGAHQHKPG